MLFSALMGSLVVLWRLRKRIASDPAERLAIAKKRTRAIAVAAGVMSIYLVEVIALALGATAFIN